MNEREKSIFLEGFEAGLKFAEKFNSQTEAGVKKPANILFDKMKKSRRGKRKSWTENDDNIIRENADKKVKEYIHLLPSRTIASISWRRTMLGIKRKKEEVKDNDLANLNQ